MKRISRFFIPCVLSVLVAVTTIAEVTITTVSKEVGKDGGAFSVNTGGSGEWVATTEAEWITLNRASGEAGVSCVCIVGANFSADTRIGLIDIAGNTFTVYQTGYTATISPTSASADYTGGSGIITITVDAGVTWSATTSCDWLSVSPETGLSNGSVIYTIAPYQVGVTTRTGSITVAGQTFTVSQTGTDVTIAPDAVKRDYNAGVFEIAVSALASTSWTITPHDSWISVVDEGYGYGNSTIMIAVGENPSVATRTGTVSIGSKTLTVTQKGMVSPVLSITPTEATASPVGAFGNVAVYATPDATWTAESLSPWISLSEGATGAGNGNIKYVAAANPTLSERIGHIMVTPPHHTPDPDIYAGLACKIIDGANVDGGSCRFLEWNNTPSSTDAFNQALNSSLTFTTDGNAPWYVVTDNARDGMAMRSGNIGDNQNSYLRTTVHGAGTMSFWYKVSSQVANSFNRFSCQVDNQSKLDQWGEVNWTRMEIPITGAGAHDIVWQFADTALRINAGSMCGWIDQVTWSPNSRLSSSFTGSSPLLLDGTPFLQKDDNTFSMAVSFRAGELDRVNRLLKVGGKSLYLDTENHIVFEKAASDWTVSATNLFYTVVLRHDAAGMVSVFAGERDGELEKVVETTCDTILKFTEGPVASSEIVLGETVLPSPGYLTDGQMANFRFWTRALTDEETMGADMLEGTLYDSTPVFTPPGAVWNYFPLDGNALSSSSSNSAPHLEGGVSYDASDMDVTDNRHGVEQRAVSFGDNGAFSMNKASTLFSSTEQSATYSIWFKLGADAFPISEPRTLMQRGAGAVSWEVSVLPSGAIRLYNNGAETDFDVRLVEANRWYMLTLVGVSGQSLQLYLDDEEIGNVPSTLAIGYTGAEEALSFGVGRKCLDDFSIFHEALTSAQVRQLYEAGKDAIVYHTVMQGVIDPLVSPTAVSFDAAGGSTNVQLTVAANTQWSATSGDEWITVTSEGASAGSARVAFDVAPNPSTEARTGTLWVAGKTVTVSQSGLWSELAYDGKVFQETSDSGFIDVQVEGNGTWTASTDADWLTLLTESGSGSGSIMFVVDGFNTTVASRTAAVTIAGKTIYITQCGYQLSIEPAVAEIGSNAGAGEIGISAPIDVVWEAIVSSDWITLVGGATGVGSGTLRYTVADNTTGETRTGKIIISGQEYTVTQLCSLKLETTTDGEGTVSGAGNYETNEQATLTATPASGYAFSHWSGDAVGVEPTVTITMDTSKTVTAHFIPEDAAQRLAEEKAAQGGFYTREQLKALAMGNTVIEVESGTVDLSVQLLETADLVSGDWNGADVEEGNGSVNVDAEGKVHIRVTPKGNTAFYRLVNVTEGEE